MGAKGKNKMIHRDNIGYNVNYYGNNDDMEYRRLYKKYKNKYIQGRDLSGGGIDNLSNWIYKEGAIIDGIKVEDGPVQYYSEIVKLYGPPSVYNNKPNGICIWIKGNTEKDIFPHEEIILRDGYVAHSRPVDHYDFMYSFIKVYIPPKYITKILKTTESVTYDPLKKILGARCGSFAANYATFRTVLNIIDDEDADYGKNIMNKIKEEVDNEKYVISKMQSNQQKYKDEFKKPKYDLEKI